MPVAPPTITRVSFRIALALLVLLAYGLRVHGLHHQSLWLDEVDAIAFAQEPIAVQVKKLAAVGENGPLYFLFYRGWLALAGTTEFGARYLSALASTLTVPLIALVARRLFRSRGVALAAAALAATSPYAIWYAQDAKMYPLYAALALGAQYCFLRAWGVGSGQPSVVGGRWSEDKGQQALAWVGYVLASSFALYVHLFAALQIAANTLAGVWLWRRHPQGRREFVLATALLIAPYLPLFVWQRRVLLEGANVGYQSAALAAMAVALLEQFFWHLDRPPDRRWLVLLVAIAALGLWRTVAGVTGRPGGSGRPGCFERQWTSAAVVATWLVVPVLLTLALQSRVPVFRDRYLIPLLAPLLLLLARALVPSCRSLDQARGRASGAGTGGSPSFDIAGRGRSRAVGVGYSVAAAGFVCAGFAYGLWHRPPNPDFRTAAHLVRTLASPGEPIAFVAEYAERPFRHYFVRGLPAGRAAGAGAAGAPPYEKSYEKLVLPYTNYPDMSEEAGRLAVTRSLGKLGAGSRLWVVRFEPWLWDGRDLAVKYLASRGARVLFHRDLHGVSVTRYELPPL